MTVRISRTNIVKNIFVTPLLLQVFLICILISFVLTVYSNYYVMPVFTDLLIKNIEKEAQRTGEYLSSSILIKKKNTLLKTDTDINNFLPPGFILNSELFTDDVVAVVEEAQRYFYIEKLKVFDKSGKIVFSTDSKDIGKINLKPYFQNQVAKGELFSKIVNKDTQSAEGIIMKRDVAEIYVPIMNQSGFKGALEIYYDISERKNALDNLVSRTLLIIYFVTGVFLYIIMVMLYKGSLQVIKRRITDDELQTAKDLLEIRVKGQTREITLTQKVSIEALAILAEYHDEDTGEHLNRIKLYVELLVVWLKENSIYKKYLHQKTDYVNVIKLACLLHDVGKTAIPLEILIKPAKLTDEEFDIVKTHTTIAGESLGRANDNYRQAFNEDSYLALARDIALYHHEKWNGKGYPKGLSGEEIPLSARIVAVADVYDALRSKRPYKKPWSHREAYDEILKGKAEHFDPVVIDAFCAMSDTFCSISEKNNDDST